VGPIHDFSTANITYGGRERDSKRVSPSLPPSPPLSYSLSINSTGSH
jgi:hypothetical protein